MRTKELCYAIAEILSSELGWQWRPDGPAYTTADTTPIFYGALGATPGRGVAVAQYDSADDVKTGLAERRIQLRFRGDPEASTDADDLADEAFETLQGLARVAGISLVVRALTARLGPDGSNRQERADSYLITLDNPEA